MLSYASYALDNWRRLEASSRLHSTTLCSCKTFWAVWMRNGSWSFNFQIERQAGSGLAGLVQAMNGAGLDPAAYVPTGLRALASAQTQMRDTLLRMKERCDPERSLHARPSLYSWLEEQPHVDDGPSTAA